MMYLDLAPLAYNLELMEVGEGTEDVSESLLAQIHHIRGSTESSLWQFGEQFRFRRPPPDHPINHISLLLFVTNLTLYLSFVFKGGKLHLQLFPSSLAECHHQETLIILSQC
jgi:hypothetical protein